MTIQHQHTLENGLTVLAETVHTPSVSFELRIPCGSSNDPIPGAAHALEGWLYKGAAGFPARELAARQDDLGLQRGGGAGLEYTRLNANLLPEDLDAAFGLYRQLLLEPHLEDADLEPLLDLARQDLEALEDSPTDLLFVDFRQRLYASRHRYPTPGTLESLEQLSPEVVRSLRPRYTPHGATLAVSGRFDWQELLRLAQRHFGDWSGPEVALEPVALEPRFEAHHEQDSAQTHLALQYPAEHPTSAQWYPFVLALGALSGGSSSRLFSEVREKRGLVYSVSASSELMGPLGFLGAYAGCTPEKAPETLAVLREQIETLHRGIGSGELERARVALLSGLVQSGESARARCGALGRDFAWRGRTRTLEEVETAIRGVTLEAVNRYLEAHPFRDPSILTLGPGPAVAGHIQAVPHV